MVFLGCWRLAHGLGFGWVSSIEIGSGDAQPLIPTFIAEAFSCDGSDAEIMLIPTPAGGSVYHCCVFWNDACGKSERTFSRSCLMFVSWKVGIS